MSLLFTPVCAANSCMFQGIQPSTDRASISKKTLRACFIRRARVRWVCLFLSLVSRLVALSNMFIYLYLSLINTFCCHLCTESMCCLNEPINIAAGDGRIWPYTVHDTVSSILPTTPEEFILLRGLYRRLWVATALT